ncbi:HAD family hydrolase [uncultured Bosea sp.]|uniref:HAD family hydrolase n=1 Tax=uncultured Bosea sp. TaxID=211457 RepID=UPI0025F75A04|nr:HAD family hydrolase [uncultured Bosea sp.]
MTTLGNRWLGRAGVRAVCFDAFGTVVEIGDKRRPFRALLGEYPSGANANQVLTQPLDLRSVARSLTAGLDVNRLGELERDLQAEITSVQLRDGIADIWKKLQREGIKIGICSNLAMPYGPPLIACLPSAPDALVLSYEVGLAKPDPAIFHLVCERLGFAAQEILFVGDTQSADIDGPRAIGMPAIHISEFTKSFEER